MYLSTCFLALQDDSEWQVVDAGSVVTHIFLEVGLQLLLPVRSLGALERQAAPLPAGFVHNRLWCPCTPAACMRFPF